MCFHLLLSLTLSLCFLSLFSVLWSTLGSTLFKCARNKNDLSKTWLVQYIKPNMNSGVQTSINVCGVDKTYQKIIQTLSVVKTQNKKTKNKGWMFFSIPFPNFFRYVYIYETAIWTNKMGLYGMSIDCLEWYIDAY